MVDSAVSPLTLAFLYIYSLYKEKDNSLLGYIQTLVFEDYNISILDQWEFYVVCCLGIMLFVLSNFVGRL